jgi:hypothetical protein
MRELLMLSATDASVKKAALHTIPFEDLRTLRGLLQKSMLPDRDFLEFVSILV